MILVDKVQHTAEEVANRFGAPYEKIRKTPAFYINPGDVVAKAGQSKEISSKAGSRVMASIIVKENGKSVEIRYCETINEVWKGEKLVPEYFPRKITFTGEVMIIQEDNMDLAVFMYLTTFNMNSPFRKKNAPYSWFFKDIELESQVEMNKNTALMEAMYSISEYEGEPLRIVAKGLGVTGARDLPDNAIKNEMIKRAMAEPEEFNEKLGSQATQFRGLILNGVDTGLFVIKHQSGRQTWFWNAGQYAGRPIIDIVDTGTDQNEVLVEQILYKISEYYPILVSAVKTVNAKSNAEEFLADTNLNLRALFNGAASTAPAPERKPEPVAEFGGGSDEVSDSPINLGTVEDEGNKSGEDDFNDDTSDDDLGGDDDFVFPDVLGLGTPDAKQDAAGNSETDNDDDLEIPPFLQPKAKASNAKKTSPKK